MLALYAQRLNCVAIFLPNAVADPSAFPPGPKLVDRPIAIGYRAFDGVMYLGHNDRRRIAEIMEPAANARGLACDISLDPSRRLGGADWTAFLHACRAQLGVEAGTDYFELDDRSRVKGNALEVTRPGIGFDEYFEIVFGGYPGRVSGRTITSRHLECATTHTPMIMFPGKYCGVFEANRHYLALDRDGGNREDILDQLADDGRCTEIAVAANDAAIEHFSEARLTARLRRAIADVAS
ncbi:MAG: hypothetical protein IBJ15_02485 [Alphaproteobacteria bacterium]|nr:hypothetical protein [Alphaproteobacteria bacterium]